MAIATVNPVTGETLKTYEPLSDEALEEKIARAAAAWEDYRGTSAEQRAGWLRAAADVLDADTDTVAELMTTEMGKTLASAKAEVAKCAKALRWYAEHGPGLLEPQPGDAEAVGASDAYVVYQPIGVVLAIMPWNFPLWQAMRFAAPALMAGNVGLLKHASNVPQTALYMEELFRKAGLPDDVFQTLLIGSGAIEKVLRDDRVAAATLTGSAPAGQSVASIAGDALKPTVLELGGSDPFIVMPSANLEKAAEIGVTARNQNNGQSCIAAKRFFVHRDVAEEFTRLFAEKIAALTVGDPMDENTDVGPVISRDDRDRVKEWIDEAASKGAEILTGGELVDEDRCIAPTVIKNDPTECHTWKDEIFGPVATIHTFKTFDEALEMANDSRYGLQAGVFTRDVGNAKKAGEVLEFGGVLINEVPTFRTDQMPYGGVKDSGNTREGPHYAVRELTEERLVTFQG
jgi:succinate-semialdehyde dehydrogenase / glutarate-semialdehyde dehydrogenase